MDSSSQPAAIDACRVSGGGERNQRREEDDDEETAAAEAEAGNGSQLMVVPEDGYEWKKYGQKFIKNIQKIRYFLPSIHFHVVSATLTIYSCPRILFVRSDPVHQIVLIESM